MIALFVAAGVFLPALQATINAPRDAFRTCIKQAGIKAGSEKVAADAFEGYIINACTAEHGKFRSALVTFDMKNGMGKKAAGEDADLTVADYVASLVDNYKFMAERNAPAAAPATTAAPAATAVAAAAQPPKP